MKIELNGFNLNDTVMCVKKLRFVFNGNILYNSNQISLAMISLASELMVLCVSPSIELLDTGMSSLDSTNPPILFSRMYWYISNRYLLAWLPPETVSVTLSCTLPLPIWFSSGSMFSSQWLVFN